MTRDEIVEFIEDQGLGDEEIILFDGLEAAFVGIATRFEPVYEAVVNEQHETLETRVKGGTHRYYAVYDHDRIIRGHVEDGMTWEEAEEYHSFNTEGAYVGETTPAILYSVEST